MRNSSISKMAEVMDLINGLSGDIKKETFEQGKELDEINKRQKGTAENVEKATEELNKANENQKGCIIW